MMQSITFQSPADADGKVCIKVSIIIILASLSNYKQLTQTQVTVRQSPFRILCLPAELRNKIYRYSVVEDQSGYRIRSLMQPPLTCVSRQIRLETLPMYYGQNRFLLSITHKTAKRYRKAWPDFIRMFRAFEAGRTGGRGTGSLQFIRDLKCEIIPTSADSFRRVEVCFMDFEGPHMVFDHASCRNRWNRNVVFSRTGAQNWQDLLSVHRFVGKYLKDVLGVTDGRCVWHLLSTVVMVAKECPGATKEIHFHADRAKFSGGTRHRSRGKRLSTVICHNLHTAL